MALPIDFLWWIDAPAWQKMYFFGIIGGVAFSFWFYMEFIIPELHHKVKEVKKWWKNHKENMSE